MNVWTGTGRLTKDPVIRASHETTVARFTLAVNRKYKKDGDNADFISCVAFGKTAEFIEKYIAKGTKIEVVGRIQTDSYTNKDGSKVYTTDVVAESVDFAESKKEKKKEDDFINVEYEGEIPFA